jgi:hypothetical protein
MLAAKPRTAKVRPTERSSKNKKIAGYYGGKSTFFDLIIIGQ